MAEAPPKDPEDSARPPGAGQSPAARVPRHVAFIMDGNGRWARMRTLPRLRGHEHGATSLRRITRYCRSLGISEVTFFALSTENFRRRPAREVGFLMKLLKSYLVSERTELLENGIRLKVVGRVEELPEDVQSVLRETVDLTSKEARMVLRLALNYGGRQDVLGAVRRIVDDLESGRLSFEQARSLNEEGFSSYLDDPEMSDPDLLIRTAGEFRLSNFLLWQCSYSEVWVTPTLWPDFDVPELEQALRSFGSRERKFGALGPQENDLERV